MAALVASPLSSPLASPTRFLPDFHTEQTPTTTALVDGLLEAWSAQQSRSTSLDGKHYGEEPTSFPFPSSLEPIQPRSNISLVESNSLIPDICSTNIPAVNFSDFTELDLDLLFGDFDQNAFGNAYSDCQTFLNIAGTNQDENGVSVDQCAQHDAWCLGTWCANDTRIAYPEQGTVNSGLPLSESQNPTFALNESSLQYSKTGSQSGDIVEGIGYHQATHASFHWSPPHAHPSPFTTLSPASQTYPTPLNWIDADSSDQNYSSASSNRKRRKIDELQLNVKSEHRDSSGAVIAAEFTLGHEKVSRQPYSAVDKAKTKDTRKRGACDFCKANKKRCNRPESKYECCKNCRPVRNRVFSMPCFVAKIIEAQLFRNKPSPMHPRSGLRRTIFQSLTDIVPAAQRQRPIVVTLTQDLGLQMLVVLARYDPMPGESTHRMWKKDGQTRRLELPPYCVANMQDAQRHMSEYITNFRSAWLKHVLGRSNDITRSLFDQAQRFAVFNPQSTVSKALDLCASSRIIERDWRICGGPSDLGIPLVSDDPSNPFYDFVPITPMMDAQLDQIVIQSFLLPTRNTLLETLQAKMTSESSSSSFFEIFLTVAVLLSHGEWLLSHSRQSARRVGATKRYNYLPRAEAYFHACNTLIAYWHHMCRGMSLVQFDWKDEATRTWAALDQEQVGFLDDLKRRVCAAETKSMMLRLRRENKYEAELYWCHQLFFPDWVAGAKHVEEEEVAVEGRRLPYA